MSSTAVSEAAAWQSLRAGVKKMSMYSELLACALRDSESEGEGEALAALVERVRLRHQILDLERVSQGTTPNAVNGIVSELQYDLALLRLCREFEISFDVTDFERPAGERRRLEQALELSGISLTDVS
jgi:hypothetical protein